MKTKQLGVSHTATSPGRYRGLCLLIVLVGSYQLPNTFADGVSATVDEHIVAGRSLLATGHYGQAILELNSAVDTYVASEQKESEIRARLLLAKAQNKLGEFADASLNLEQAAVVAKFLGDGDLMAAVSTQLGNVVMVTGTPESAERLFRKAIHSAISDSVKAVAYNNLGNYYSTLSHTDQALASYSKVAQLANLNSQPQLVANALANSARLQLDTGNPDQVTELIRQSVVVSNTLTDTRDKAFLLMNLGRTAQRINFDGSEQLKHYRRYALLLFGQAEKFSRINQDNAAISYALGYKAKLYEKDKRYDDVLKLSRQAIFFAQQLGEQDAQFLLGKWNWQIARAHRELDQPEEAIEAYQIAIRHFGAMRYAMQYVYGQQQSGFEATINPVYQEFTQLLFQVAQESKNTTRKSSLLRLARDTIEDLKAAELRDYFQDSCVDELRAKIRDIGEVSNSALIVYPIILEDRLELLLHLPGGELINRSVSVSRHQLEKTIDDWRIHLETPSNQHRKEGVKLYQWLVTPYESDLTGWGVDTLVFVPDGDLRQVPMAALWNGKHFLIEQYPVAITPGINLSDPKRIDIKTVKPLYAGISESIQDFPALPFVSNELEDAQSIFKGKVLLNDTFTTAGLTASLEDQSINILHLATHGEFSQNANQSFILTYDGKRTINELAKDIQTFKFRDKPLDLLVLSACETARGDNRAALGLSGIAIKAGARSALGTLWRVSDEAAAGLMQAFYQALQEPGVSRATALQKAQLALMNQREQESRASFKYPAFWSPFIMINSWL